MTSGLEPEPEPMGKASARRRAIRTFVVLLVAVLLFAVAADMAGIQLPRGIVFFVGIPVALVGAVLSYRGVVR